MCQSQLRAEPLGRDPLFDLTAYKSSAFRAAAVGRADGRELTVCRYEEVSNDRLFKPLLWCFAPLWELKGKREPQESTMTLSPEPFEDPSTPRTSPSEYPQTFMALFSLLYCFEWLCVSQRLLFRMRPVAARLCGPTSINRSASVCQWTWRVTHSPDRFSFQEGFSRLTHWNILASQNMRCLAALKWILHPKRIILSWMLTV